MQQLLGIAAVVDREVGVEADLRGVAAQQARADAVEGAAPRQLRRAAGSAAARAPRAAPGRPAVPSRAAARREKVSSRMRDGSAPASDQHARPAPPASSSCPSRRRRRPAAARAPVDPSSAVHGGAALRVVQARERRRSEARCRWRTWATAAAVAGATGDGSWRHGWRGRPRTVIPSSPAKRIETRPGLDQRAGECANLPSFRHREAEESAMTASTRPARPPSVLAPSVRPSGDARRHVRARRSRRTAARASLAHHFLAEWLTLVGLAGWSIGMLIALGSLQDARSRSTSPSATGCRCRAASSTRTSASSSTA